MSTGSFLCLRLVHSSHKLCVNVITVTVVALLRKMDKNIQINNAGVMGGDKFGCLSSPFERQKSK